MKQCAQETRYIGRNTKHGPIILIASFPLQCKIFHNEMPLGKLIFLDKIEGKYYPRGYQSPEALNSD